MRSNHSETSLQERLSVTPMQAQRFEPNVPAKVDANASASNKSSVLRLPDYRQEQAIHTRRSVVLRVAKRPCRYADRLAPHALGSGICTHRLARSQPSENINLRLLASSAITIKHTSRAKRHARAVARRRALILLVGWTHCARYTNKNGADRSARGLDC